MGLISWLKSKFEKHKEEKKAEALEPAAAQPAPSEPAPQPAPQAAPAPAQPSAEPLNQAAPVIEPAPQPEAAAAEVALEAATIEQPVDPIQQPVFEEKVEETVATEPAVEETPAPVDTVSAEAVSQAEEVVAEPEQQTELTSEAADLEAAERARIEAEKEQLIAAASTLEVAPATVGVAPDLPVPESEDLASKQEASTWYAQAETEFASAVPFEFHPFEDPRIASLQPADKWYAEAETEAAGVEPFEFEPYEDPHKSSLQGTEFWYGPAEKAASAAASFQFTPYVAPVKEEPAPVEPAVEETPAPAEETSTEVESQPDVAEIEAEKARLIELAATQTVAQATVGIAPVFPEPEAENLASKQEASTWYSQAETEFASATPFEFTPHVEPVKEEPTPVEATAVEQPAETVGETVVEQAEEVVAEPVQEPVLTSEAVDLEAAERARIEAEKEQLIAAASTLEVAPATVGVAPDLPVPESDDLASKQEASTWYSQAENEFASATPFEFHPYEDPRIASLQPADKWYAEAETEAAGAEPFEFEPYEDSHKPSLQGTESWYGPAEKAASAAAPFQFTPYVEPVKEEPVPVEPEVSEQPAEPAPAEVVAVDQPVEEKVEETVAAEPAVEEKPEPAPQPMPKGNADELDDLALYNLGLGKAREGFSHRLSRIAKKYKQANADYFDELEECLIEADVGVDLALRVLDTTETMAAQQHLSDTSEINDLLVDNMFMDYAKTGGSYRTDVEFDPVNPTILMVVGVNGTGKTTTIAKLALRYKEKGKKVLVVAADTFRAGAVEQLRIWAGRVGVDCYDKGMGAEPAAVCYDAVHKAIDERYDLVIVDTAGRLHTKDYLMKELGKLVRVIGKIIPDAPQEVWLALDANTGQNGVQQSKVFKEVCSLTGIVITKMDGTSKGGIILAIRDQLGIPVRFIGLGEHEHDLREFDLDKYLYGLLVGGEE